MRRLVLKRFFKPFGRLLLRTIPSKDPWYRVPCEVPLARFGMGACHDFSWYFEGESTVNFGSVSEIQSWLLGCAYVRDKDLYARDVWQHPAIFEQIRKGDCEDFAVWTWRQLVRLGFEADLVAGRYTCPALEPANHTWVLMYDRGKPFLFDPIIRDQDRMLRPLTAVRDDYLPEVSVDRCFNRYVYRGYVALLRHRMDEEGTISRLDTDLVRYEAA